MKKLLVLICSALTLASGAAGAEDIAGRLGISGKIGFIVPADSETALGGTFQNISTDTSFIGGGGFIYGINKNLAAEFDITYTSFDGNMPLTSYSFDTLTITLGGQYRFQDMNHFVPYAGAGLDILVNGVDHGYDVDTTLGLHLSGGLDYFITKSLAVNTEMKIILAPNADITAYGVKVGNFDPSSFSMTFGVRYFIN